MTQKLVQAISKARDAQTCYPGSKSQRSSERKSLGQCAVTALLIQDILGWEILYNTDYHHYRNRLPNGIELDLTKDQFEKDITINSKWTKNRNELLFGTAADKAKTYERYELLKYRVMSILQGIDEG